jgi:hypothetical protein
MPRPYLLDYDEAAGPVGWTIQSPVRISLA